MLCCKAGRCCYTQCLSAVPTAQAHCLCPPCSRHSKQRDVDQWKDTLEHGALHAAFEGRCRALDRGRAALITLGEYSCWHLHRHCHCPAMQPPPSIADPHAFSSISLAGGKFRLGEYSVHANPMRMQVRCAPGCCCCPVQH